VTSGCGVSLCAQIPSFLGVLSLALYILHEFITSVVNESDDALAPGRAQLPAVSVSTEDLYVAGQICWRS